MTHGMIVGMPRPETPEQVEIRKRLREIGKQLRDIDEARAQVVKNEAETARRALMIGVRQSDIARDLDRSREHIRQITLEDRQ